MYICNVPFLASCNASCVIAAGMSGYYAKRLLDAAAFPKRHATLVQVSLTHDNARGARIHVQPVVSQLYLWMQEISKECGVTKQIVRAALDLAIPLAKWKKLRIESNPRSVTEEKTAPSAEYGEHMHINPILSSMCKFQPSCHSSVCVCVCDKFG